MIPLARRLTMFALLPLVSAFAPLLVLPLIARSGGPEVWAAVGIGSAVGSLASSFGFAGWSIAGTADVAMNPDRAFRRDLYHASLRDRLVVASALLPLGSIVVLMIVPSAGRLEGTLFFLAFGIGSLGMGWFATGTGRPVDILLYEALPKLAAAILGSLIVSFGHVIWPYPLLVLIATLAGVGLFSMRTLGRRERIRRVALSVNGSLRARRAAWAVEVIGSGYSSIPVPIAGMIASPMSTASYVSSDRTYRYGLFGVNALGNGLQSWVLETGSARRHTLAVGLHLLLGLFGFTVLVLFGPLLTATLFGESVAAPTILFVPLGIAYFSTSVATPLLRNVLIPSGEQQAIMKAVGFAGAVGLVLMVGGGIVYHEAFAVAVGLAISEFLSLVCVVFLSRRVWGRRRVK